MLPFYNEQSVYNSRGTSVTAATINPYRTQMDQLVDGVAGTVTTRHHDIGLVYASKTPQIARITLQESLSIASKSGSETDRRAGYNMQAITLSEIEGMVAPLEDGAQFSFASMFFKTNALPLRYTNDIVNGRVYLVAPSNMATFLASQPDAVPTPSFHGAYPAGWTCGTECWRKLQLQSIANQGYSTLIMEGGQSELFFDASSATQDKKAYTIWEYMKGGAAVSDPFQVAMKTTEVIDAASKARKELSISQATGDLTYQAQPDIVTGAGDFPYSLPFIRTFTTTFRDRMQTLDVTTEPRNCTQNCGLQTTNSHVTRPAGSDGAFHDRLGGGWDHNYNISLTLTNNPVKGLGNDYALDGARNIARLRVIRDLGMNTDPNTSLASQVTMITAAMYMGYSMDAVVKIGSSTDTLRAESGGWYSTQSPNAKLVTTSTPYATEYTYTSANGDSLVFDKSAAMGEYNPSTSTLTLKEISKTWLPARWNFPSGVVVNFNYTLVPYATGDERPACQYSWGWSCAPWRMPVGYRLMSVSNNLGRSLTFTNNGSVTLHDYINTTVTDENGRQAVFTNSGCVYMQSDGGSAYWYKHTTTCSQFTAKDANGFVTKYEYTPSGTLVGTRNNYRLTKIFTPTNNSVPFQAIDYDVLGRVTKVTDRNNRSTFYYPGGLNGNERWKPSYTVSPGGERFLTVFSEKGSDILSRSPMGRETRKTFDNANRLAKTILPEGNGSQNFYDARSNVVKTRAFSKTCGATQVLCSDDIITQTDYMGDETSMTCTNSVTCNKPQSETDARGNVTTYSWNSTTGDLLSLTAPQVKSALDSDALINPITTLGYTTYNGISFLTSKTEKISSGQSVTTAYSYNSSNHYALQTVTADSGGLNLTTALGFDAVGNLVSNDGPLPGTGDTTTYQWDPGRRITMVISPDPDGGGPLLRKAIIYNYNADDLVIRTVKGTATGSDGSGFVPLTSEVPTYDLMGNKTQVLVTKP